MLRIREASKDLERLTTFSLAEVGFLERQHLQQLIKNGSKEFFAEMGERLLLIGEEVQPSDFVQNRIDLLAIDPSGAIVVIELKRGNDRLHLLQGLAYAAMVSRWAPDDVANALASMRKYSKDDAEDSLRQFLEVDYELINESQRVILISEDFDFEVLVTAEWMTENYGLNIRCYRLQLSKDGDAKYLSCTGIYPPPEIREHAVRRGNRSTETQPQWNDWDQALSAIHNSDLAEFFRQELARGVPGSLGRRYLRYALNGAGRLFVTARPDYAYVWQKLRFEDDEVYWRSRLSAPDDVAEVSDGEALRFRLVTKEDFVRFGAAVTTELLHAQFR